MIRIKQQGQAAVLLLAFVSTGGYANTESSADAFLEMSLEDLLAVEVTSVSKSLQSLREVAAAVYVMSSEEIHRSSALTLPDLLRLVPGVNVAQLDAHRWAVSVRGFNSLFANKLLVLVDGRSIYTPLFGGVLWELQDLPLEDIERIEVIRGPGGTIWGANAVNGVINIITRDAADTQGTLVSLGSGSEEKGLVTLRHGGVLSEDTHYRTYAKWRKRDDAVRQDNGDQAHDGTDFALTGFRIDRQSDDRDGWTLQGDLFETRSDLMVAGLSPDATSTMLTDTHLTRGANLLGRWKREPVEGGEYGVKGYYDYMASDIGILEDRRDIFDIEFQHQLRPLGRHTLTWGAGYRYIDDRTEGSFTLGFNRQNRRDHLFSAYLQDEISLASTLDLTLGNKLERNDYTGLEMQPSARLVWTPTDNQVYWASISRAVHTPTRMEEDIVFRRAEQVPEVPLPAMLELHGNANADSERLTAYEAGFRSQLNARLSLDAALFYNEYDRLFGLLAGAPEVRDGFLLLPGSFANDLTGTSHGGELSLLWQASPEWRLQVNYSYLDLSLHSSSGSSYNETDAGRSPRHQASLQSSLALGEKADMNMDLRHVSELAADKVPGYTEMDLRFDWRPQPGVELSLMGRNLLDGRHAEFKHNEINGVPSEVERSVFLQLRLDY